MRAGKLDISLLVNGHPLREFGSERQSNGHRECFVLPNRIGTQSFQVNVRDDTTNFLDTYDLRAEVVILIDGREVLRTRKCILLRDISEYEFRNVVRTNVPSVPFLFADQDDLDCRKRETGHIEIIYRRFHKTYTPHVPHVHRDSDSATSSLSQGGSTLSFGEELKPDLKSLRFSFKYFTREMLRTLSTRFDHLEEAPSPAPTVWNDQALKARRGDLYEMNSRDAFHKRVAKL